MLEGHAHLPEHAQKKSTGSNTEKKSKGKKKESSKKRRGRGRSQQNADSDHDNEDDDDEDEDDSDTESDNSLDIWACEFEPSTDIPSTTVALCGGSNILFLDTQQGRYVKKYTHPEPLECFYTLAWTLLRGSQQLGRSATVTSNNGEDSNSTSDDDEETFAAILAAAGKFGSIKLLEPTQTQCYRYLFGHQQPVLKVGFSKKEPRWLLSKLEKSEKKSWRKMAHPICLFFLLGSSMDMTVRLWDIGTPSNENDDSR